MSTASRVCRVTDVRPRVIAVAAISVDLGDVFRVLGEFDDQPVGGRRRSGVSPGWPRAARSDAHIAVREFCGIVRIDSP
jgi:hypothetical protein